MNIEKLVSIFMKEFRPKVKYYTIENYYNYNYFHSIDIKWKENDYITVIHTLELNITSKKMVDLVLKEESIQKHIIKEIIR